MGKIDFKVPGVGRVALKNPIYHEKAGYGRGRVDMKASQAPVGELSFQVLRGIKYQVGDRVVDASELRDLSEEDRKIATRIEGTGYAVPAKEFMSWRGRFWGNIRGNDLIVKLGTGLVTNVGVTAMANEYAWANPSAAVNTVLALSNWHATGTGATADAATDLQIQTISTQGGQTPVAGVQSLVSAANSQKYKSVATISYTGTETVSEWGLFTGNTLSGSTGTPFTATSATSGTVTGTPLTASSTTVAGSQMNIVLPGTTTVYGLVLSNTTSVFTIPAWYTVAAGTAGSTPGATEAFTTRPVMWDHRKFTGVGVNNGDSIQFTYTVTINSGG